MEFHRRIKSNWLTRKPAPYAEKVTTAMAVVIAVVTWMYWNDIAQAQKLLAASGEQVFVKHEFWRLWTSLLVHGDLGHLVSNAILFIPLSFFLTGYFGPFFFPVFGFLVGGLTNFIALKTMPLQTELIGVSGVVYWMGAAWLTLYLCLERRESVRRRLGKVLFIAAALFLPQTFEPNVSYVSHLYGFIIGLPSALIYYWVRRHTFAAHEEFEEIFETDDLALRVPHDFDAIAGRDVFPEELNSPVD